MPKESVLAKMPEMLASEEVDGTAHSDGDLSSTSASPAGRFSTTSATGQALVARVVAAR